MILQNSPQNTFNLTHISVLYHIRQLILIREEMWFLENPYLYLDTIKWGHCQSHVFEYAKWLEILGRGPECCNYLRVEKCKRLYIEYLLYVLLLLQGNLLKYRVKGLEIIKDKLWLIPLDLFTVHAKHFHEVLNFLYQLVINFHFNPIKEDLHILDIFEIKNWFFNSIWLWKSVLLQIKEKYKMRNL